MIGRRAVLAGVAGAVLGIARVRAAAGALRFRRGIAIDNLVYWGHLEPGDAGHYGDDPFSGPEHTLPDALLARVVAAGFDFVRLTVDPGPFLDLAGEPRDALDRRLAGAVRRLRGFGLSVLVDLHPNTQVRAYDSVTWLSSDTDPMIGRYLALVRRTARLLGRMDDPGVGFEPMNEPPYGYDRRSAARWQSLLEELHGAARAEAPALLLVLSGARGGSAAGLMDVDPAPFRGGPILWSFHYYEPHVFTHEGVVSEGEGTRSWRYMSDLPWPTGREPRDAVLATVTRNVEADASLDPAARRRALRDAIAAAEAYLSSGAGPATVAADFDAVLGWARRGGVAPGAVLLGEFGVTRSYGRYRAADPVSREAWLRAVRTAAEARAFGWSLWELVGSGGMATVTEDGATTLDPGTLRALGLREPAP